MAKADKVVAIVDQTDEDIESIVSFSEDISTAEAPLPLPERDYPATIMEAVRSETKHGDPMCVLKFKIDERDFPADYDAGNAPGGKTITHYLVMQDSPAGRHRIKRFCEAVGAPMSKHINLQSFVGLNASITLKHEEYEGQTREKIQRVSLA